MLKRRQNFSTASKENVFHANNEVKPANPYSEEARKWAIRSCIFHPRSSSDPNWNDPITLEQFITILYRFATVIGVVYK